MDEKYNLDDLPQINIDIAVDTKISTVVYNAMTGDIKERIDSTEFILSLLVALRGDAESLKIILRHEIEQLKYLPFNTCGDKIIILQKIEKYFLEKVNLDNIMVFSSLSGLTETKASIYFRGEIASLAEALNLLVVDFIENFKDLEEDDTSFHTINNNISYLKKISDKVVNYSVKNLKKISNEFVNSLDFEEHIRILSTLVNRNTKNLLPRIPTDTLKIEKDEIYDAEVLEEEKDEKSENISAEALNDRLDKLEINIEKLINGLSEQEEDKNLIINKMDKILHSEPKEKVDKDTLLANKIIEMENNIKSLTEINNRISENAEKTLQIFTDFIARQTKMTKIIEEKYNIKINL